MEIMSIDGAILLFSVMLLIGVVTTKFSTRLGLPSLVLFIAVGMALSHYIYYDNAALTQLFGVVALIVILFEGGLQTQWTSMKKVLAPSVTLATLGVVVTSLLIGVIAKFTLDLTWLEGILFGSIVGSTDAAAVFAVLGNKNIEKRLTNTLEAESGTNDPMAIFLTVTFISLIQIPEFNGIGLAFSFVWQMGFGVLMGILFGKGSLWIINKINLDSSGLYPVLSFSLAVLTYGVTTLLGASGFLAVYVMAVFLGNSDLTYRHSIFRFNEGFAWMMQILMFVLLGLLVFPGQLLDVAWEGVWIALILMIVARPLGVFASLAFFPYSLKEKIFISWGGLKGAVPIVLATFPLLAGIENSGLIFNVVFFVVLLSALVQGATINPIAKRLGLSKGEKQQSNYSLELVSLGKTNNEIVEFTISDYSSVVGKELKDITLPDSTLITAVIRDSKLITPVGETRLCRDDIVYVLLQKDKREAIKKLFNQLPEIEWKPKKSDPIP
ncbi:potassium transporter [Bacillus coahuilensis p1.1.43]|uniref:Potassium transporter n=1 Tax=Bacillus coahuilensis p1.1.43 TaxID=1150625 RepID=A0A147K414_9BACI|nr:potassium/proton antiporter [Bacillus coahuilensis]KUP04029.1 potassium transporter [Bacillus coahuilensis p1.1.43]